MGYLGVTVVVAALVVVVTLGSFSQLAKIQVKAVGLLLGGLGIQIVITFAGIPRHLYDSLGFGLIMLSYVLILAFCFMNIGIRGIGLITIGIAMNALVIGLNQGMPTRDQPITTASGRHIRKPITPDVKHRAERSSDLLPFLSDIIWLPKPFDDEAISFGDLILAVGICELAYYASRRRFTRGAAKPEDAQLTADTPAPEPPDGATGDGATGEGVTDDGVTGDGVPGADTIGVEANVPPDDLSDRAPGAEGADPAEAQRIGTMAPRRSRTRSRAPSTRPS